MEKIRSSKKYLHLFIASILIAVICFSPGILFAGTEKFVPYDITVKGTVTDGNGNALAGATIEVKGGTQRALSDVNGSFTIVVPGTNSILVISYVGYATQEVRVGNNAQLQVSLQTGSSDLAQVVVVGYGTQNKKDVTGAVKSIKSEAFNKGIVNTPQELLQGKVAGVNVTSASGEPGSVLGITIRGPGGVRTGSTPLFVIDGLPLDNSSTGGGDPLNFINPQDIESIDVLKDASATAIYGSRGANGVVLITTRKGKAGASVLNMSASLGVSKISHFLPVFAADEFRKQVVRIGGVLDDKGSSTDWQDLVFRSAITPNYNLDLSGGADKLTYYASFNAQKQQGIMKNSQLDRYTGRFNATQRFLEDRLTVDVNLTVSGTQNERPPINAVIGDVIGNNPTYPAYGPDGNPIVFQNQNNPLMYFQLDKDITNINRVVGNISPSVRLTNDLVYKLNFGIDNSNSARDIQSLPHPSMPTREGRLETYNNYNRNYLIENYFTYTKKTGNHDISALAGHSYQKISLQGRMTSINRFTAGGVEPIYNPGVGQDLTLTNNRPSGFAVINELQSFFARATYQYNKKYLLTVNFRADGSSKFGENNKYGYFPSFSAGWKISDEDFMANSAFSNLKLRAGWGLTGNQEIPSKITQALFTTQVSASTSYPLTATGPYPAGTTFSRLANPDIQWEVSSQTDIGLDFALMNGALSGSIDAFRKVSSNILLEVPPADPIQPAPSVWTNVKDMNITNQGIELDLEYRHKAQSGMNYHIGGNFTYMHNNVSNSPYTVITSGTASGSGLTSAAVNGYINGEPVGTFYLLQFTGIGKDSLSTYVDYDKNGIISPDKDRIPLGTALPNVMYSFYGGVALKGFDLNVNFNGVSGNKIYDNTANTTFYKAKLAKSVNTTDAAVEFLNESNNNPASISSRYLKEGAFLRLNNLSLGYTFNTTSMNIRRWISALRLSVTGQNLFVITKYDGYDPEVNTDRAVNGVASYGIDYLSYPKATSVIFAINVSL